MSARRRTQGGQILPMFAIFLIVLFGMAAMVVDGGFMLESKSDLQTVAQHAADSGAQMIDVTAYNSGCVNRLSDPLCQSSLRLTAGSGGTAATRAKNVVCQWLDPLGTLSTTALRLPSVPVSGCPPDTATPVAAYFNMPPSMVMPPLKLSPPVSVKVAMPELALTNPVVPVIEPLPMKL